MRVLFWCLSLVLVPMSWSANAAESYRDCADCPLMVTIPAGSFQMGSPDNEEHHNPNESPQHSVSIPRDFGVGKFEVTFAEWDACVSGGGCRAYRPDDEGWGRGKRPVINVSWDDAQSYVTWLSNKTGKHYRLLTEAEWEYSARAGTTTAYPWGSQIIPSNAKYTSEDGTAPVGSYAANRFGLYDTQGNVAEWTEDCYNDSYNGAPGNGSAWLTEKCSLRVIRNDSWKSPKPWWVRSAYRGGAAAFFRYDGFGFRVARTN